MLGLGDGWVVAAYTLCISSTLLCIIYGIMNWNKEADVDTRPDAAAGEWIKEEIEIDKQI